MKTIYLPTTVSVLAVILISSYSLPASGGPRTYDVEPLLYETHPFSGQASPSADSAAPVQAAGNSKSDSSLETTPNAFAIFGGVMTDNTWTEVFDPDTLEFRDSTQIGFVASRRIWHYEDMLSVEIEGQIVRHFGGQDNWEFNVPIALRWHPFPWDEWLDTSFAWGIGPSYATEVPEDEVAQHGESAQWLVHWFAELEFGPPESPWSGIVRLQHRSGAFGAVADDGGSNVWAVGLRRRY